MSNKSVSVARDHRWSTTSHDIGKSLNGQIVYLLLSSSFSQASSITTEAITMPQTRRSGIFNGVLHSYQSAFKQLEFVQQWFTTTLELTLAVARHLTHKNNVTGRWIVWIRPPEVPYAFGFSLQLLWLWLRMRRLPATTCFVYLKPTFDRALCAHGCGLLASPGSWLRTLYEL